MTEEKINHRYQTLLLYEQGLLTASLAASSIGVKERQFFKILKRFRESGRKVESLDYLSHPAWNRTERELEEKTLSLNKDYPLALNSHLSWLAWDVYQVEIKSWTCRNILIREGKYIPFREKKERAYKRFSATHFGVLVQLDTKNGYWIKGFPLLHLILALDDAS